MNTPRLHTLLVVLLFIGSSFAVFSKHKIGKENRIERLDKDACAFDQWEGFLVSSYPLHNLKAFTNVSYDFTNELISLDVETVHWEHDKHEKKSWRHGDQHHNGPKFEKYNILLDFGNHISYVVDEDSNCTCHSLTHEIHRSCIPKDAYSMGTTTIGGTLEVDAYHWFKSCNEKDDKWSLRKEKREKKKDHDDNDDDDDDHNKKHDWDGISFTGVISHKSNIPISLSYRSKNVQGRTDFFGITKGISDNKIFTVPSSCTCQNARAPQPSALAKLSAIGLEETSSLPIEWNWF
jgi:hypothetical protein